MITQTLEKFITTLDLLSLPVAPAEKYHIDGETQLAAEMADALPASVELQTLPEIDPDDFEKLYGWFLA